MLITTHQMLQIVYFINFNYLIRYPCPVITFYYHPTCFSYFLLHFHTFAYFSSNFTHLFPLLFQNQCPCFYYLPMISIICPFYKYSTLTCIFSIIFHINELPLYQFKCRH